MTTTNTSMAIIAIVAALALLGGLGATTGPITTFQKAFAESQRPTGFARSDRCVTSQDQSTDSTTTTCFVGGVTDKNAVKEASKEAMESCKDAKEQGEVDKCSSSQTGNGEFCNWSKVRQGIWAIVIFPETPPCNEVSQEQNQALNN
jgi:hypothetical protein